MNDTDIEFLKGLCPNLLDLIKQLGGMLIRDPRSVPMLRRVENNEIAALFVSKDPIYVVNANGLMFKVLLESTPMHRASLLCLALTARILVPEVETKDQKVPKPSPIRQHPNTPMGELPITGDKWLSVKRETYPLENVTWGLPNQSLD